MLDILTSTKSTFRNVSKRISCFHSILGIIYCQIQKKKTFMIRWLRRSSRWLMTPSSASYLTLNWRSVSEQWRANSTRAVLTIDRRYLAFQREIKSKMMNLSNSRLIQGIPNHLLKMISYKISMHTSRTTRCPNKLQWAANNFPARHV